MGTVRREGGYTYRLALALASFDACPLDHVVSLHQASHRLFLLQRATLKALAGRLLRYCLSHRRLLLLLDWNARSYLRACPELRLDCLISLHLVLLRNVLRGRHNDMVLLV